MCVCVCVFRALGREHRLPHPPPGARPGACRELRYYWSHLINHAWPTDGAAAATPVTGADPTGVGGLLLPELAQFERLETLHLALACAEGSPSWAGSIPREWGQPGAFPRLKQ